MIVVADTSVLLNLCRIGEIDLLWQLYGKVAAPQAVQLEYERAVQAYGRFEGMVFPGFIEVRQPQKSLQS